MKDATKNDPPPTNEGDEGRVTAETVVAEGEDGINRLRSMLKRLLVGAKASLYFLTIW